MNPKAIRARPIWILLALAALAAAAAACGGRYDDVITPPSVLRVDYPAGASRSVLSNVRAVDGVASVAGLSLVDARAFAGSTASSLKLAVVDPGEIGSIAYGPTPSSLRAGSLLLSYAAMTELGVAEGSVVKLRDDDGPSHSIAVAPLTDELAIAGASAVVARDRVSWIAIGRPTMLLVGVTPQADPNATASALAATLNTQVGLAARAPSFLSGRAASTLFGSFSYVVNSDGTIRQDPRWVQRYIVNARVPIFGTVTCHRMLIPQLAAALGEVKRIGLAGEIDGTQYGGCYVARKILWDPANPVSMHAWGLAIDFNVSHNQYGARPTMHPRIVEIFERWGFAWGGRWQTPDGMHFELASLVRR
ncbi:MAG: M15 family metallopeptidase [Actinomycetota bacterium]